MRYGKKLYIWILMATRNWEYSREVDIPLLGHVYNILLNSIFMMSRL